MADALGSVIVIISALIMWFLPSQVFTKVSQTSLFMLFSGRTRGWNICWSARKPVDQVIISPQKKKSDLNQHKCVNNILVPNTDRSIWQVCWPRAFIDAGAADPQVCLATSYRVCSHPASGLSSHDLHIILCPAYYDLIATALSMISLCKTSRQPWPNSLAWSLGFPGFLLIALLSLLFVAYTGMQQDLDIDHCIGVKCAIHMSEV